MIYRVTGYRIPRTPNVALLNAHLPHLSRSTQKLIHFILLGSKIAIAKSWKQHRPLVSIAKQKISWIMIQEQLSSILANSSEVFHEIWTPWAVFVGVPLTPEPV